MQRLLARVRLLFRSRRFEGSYRLQLLDNALQSWERRRVSGEMIWQTADWKSTLRSASHRFPLPGVAAEDHRQRPHYSGELRAGSFISVGGRRYEFVQFHFHKPSRKTSTGDAYYTFTGSLTTPPPTEGFTWLVLQHPSSVSAAQAARFGSLYPMNARPVQPVNGRVIQASR